MGSGEVADSDSRAPDRGRLREVVAYFFRLGLISFGGPAAHIALMRRELVVERKWLTDQEFVDQLGVTNLIPGPNSTQMTMHLGAFRAGWRGLWMGGLSFIVPAVCITLVLAWAYVHYGATREGQALLFGIQPVILAVVVQAIWGLRRSAVKSPGTLAVVIASAALSFVGVHPLPLLLGSGVALLAAAWLGGGRPHAGWSRLVTRSVATVRRVLASLNSMSISFALAPYCFPLVDSAPALPTVASATATSSASLGELFLTFLKVGSVLYGSGYVLVSFLRADLVESRHWLTERQLLDAIAVGQVTPGPVFSSAAFAGYLVRGVPGGLLAAAGIFLPSFVLVTVTHPFVPGLRRSRWAAPFLDGVNAAALALMAVVTLTLVHNALNDAYQLALLALAAAILLRFNPNSVYLIAGGAVAGVLHSALM